MSYTAIVNKNDINMGRLATNLNHHKQAGGALVTMFEQHGNTISIYEYNSLMHQLLAEQKRTNELLEWVGQLLTHQAKRPI